MATLLSKPWVEQGYYSTQVSYSYTFLKPFADGVSCRHLSVNNSMLNHAVRYNIKNFYLTYCEFDSWNYDTQAYRGWCMNNFAGYIAF